MCIFAFFKLHITQSIANAFSWILIFRDSYGFQGYEESNSNFSAKNKTEILDKTSTSLHEKYSLFLGWNATKIWHLTLKWPEIGVWWQSSFS